MLKIGEKIKELRKAQDVTQEKLADYLNISYQAVSKWENGLALPDITLIPALAGFFGVSADYLLGIDTEYSDKVIENVLGEGISFKAYRKGRGGHCVNRKNASVISKQS
jgi:transcriptional regulator with XRE-family HTH domain